MPYPEITVIGSQENKVRTEAAIADMDNRSATWSHILENVGARYTSVVIYIGTGANAGHGPATSGQSASDANTWNVYIDNSVTYSIRGSSGAVRSPFVEEVIAHEVGHGMYGGTREGPSEHRELIRFADQVSAELGYFGETGAIASASVFGRPIQNNISSESDPLSLRFGNGSAVQFTSPMTAPDPGFRKPFASVDNDENLYVTEEIPGGGETTTVYSDTNQTLHIHSTDEVGTTDSTYFDPSNLQAWSTQTVITDASGRVTERETVDDTGTSVQSLYGSDAILDLTQERGADGLLDRVTAYDVAGRIDSVTTYTEAGARAAQWL